MALISVARWRRDSIGSGNGRCEGDSGWPDEDEDAMIA
jgi:hypothetical protein